MDAAHFFQINTGSPEPIYRQLVEQLRRRVAAGQLKAGDEIDPEEQALMQRALDENSVIVAQMTPFFD